MYPFDLSWRMQLDVDFHHQFLHGPLVAAIQATSQLVAFPRGSRLDKATGHGHSYIGINSEARVMAKIGYHVLLVIIFLIAIPHDSFSEEVAIDLTLSTPVEETTPLYFSNHGWVFTVNSTWQTESTSESVAQR